MANRNPFKNGNSLPQEAMKGDNLVNMRTQRIVRVPGPDGNIQEVVMDSHESTPDIDGGFVDTKIVTVATDPSGKALPDDPRSVIAISHTGAYITSPEEFARCTSMFHPAAGISTNIHIGLDGVILPNGAARCSHCQRIYSRIVLALAVGGIIFLLALYKAAGLY